MKRIIKLTESDLTRIVRRVIKENEESMNMDSGSKPQITDCKQLSQFKVGAGSNPLLVKMEKEGRIKKYSESNKSIDYSDSSKADTYNYVILNNNKFCYHDRKNDRDNNWEEQTDGNAKSKILSVISKR